MSSVHDADQYPGASARPGVLTSRLIDIPRQRFAEDYWGRKALLTRRSGDFADLFSPVAADELISRRGLRSPFLRVAKDGETLPVSSFTSPAGVGATIGDQLDDTALWRHFDAGATLVLQALQRTWEPIGDFATRLGEELGHPVQANAYITPPQNQGFDDHYDVHDVFVLQISGTKRWIIHEPVMQNPLRDQPWTDRRDEVAAAAAAAPAIDAVLAPGDVLYLPRGWLHAAAAQGEVSIHLTLGVHTWTGHGLAEQLAQAVIAILRDDPEIRASLPLGVKELDPGIVDMVKKRFAEALDQADPRPAFHRTRRSQARPAPLGPLAQLRAVNDLGPDTLVSWRGGLDSTFSGSRLMTRVGWLDLTDEELAAVHRLLDGEVLTCGELGDHVTRRLLRAGVVVPVLS
ncbi:cupin [Aeromicrobium sp. PE09-221]|uniref:cupin domain-containing protein n=1 Tax=Aeromicrobium sp. PE09-221 TaxID=1898043 RepID=UPI000B3EB54E|nr:cupin domain-containing protein [Aeromicrobium sp. PE09-221]OUZ12677.1 cupin [Aeromicrobium sp. PE09-221]